MNRVQPRASRAKLALVRPTLWTAALALAFAACSGTTGTISIGLTTAPGSHVLDAATTLRLSLTDPPMSYEVGRQGDGFDLAFDLDATETTGTIVVEALDATGAVVAAGQSPPFPFAAVNANVVIYLAEPMSIEPAPLALTPARSGIAIAPLPYGAIFAGGRDAAGAPSDAIAIYNVYNHTLLGGLPMPIPRDKLVIAVDSGGGVYLYGGLDAAGNPVPTLLRFNTTVAPNGSYGSLGELPGFARAGEIAVKTAADRFIVTGSPPVELAAGTLAARTELASLPPVGASLVPPDGVLTALFAGGDTGLVRLRNDAFDMLAGDARTRGTIAALPGGRFVVIGGADPSALIVDAETGAVTPMPSALATARFSPAVAATARHLVVAGGVDAAGAPIATAEIFDAVTLAPLAVVPLAPRAGTRAFAMPNDQVLIAGGDTPSDLIELFTPPPPTVPAP